MVIVLLFNTDYQYSTPIQKLTFLKLNFNQEMIMATKQSSVMLTTFAAFSKGNNSDLDIKFGSSGTHVQKNGHLDVIADNIPLRSKLLAPGNGMLMLYGHRDTTEELQKRRAEALSLGARFQFAEITVDVGPIFPGIFDDASIKTARFANLRRLTADLQEDIVDIFTSYAKDEGQDFNPVGNRIAEIATRPDLFERLLREDKRFKKLEVFIIPVKEGGLIRQVAYVKSNCKILEINQNTDAETIVFPKWFGKKVSA